MQARTPERLQLHFLKMFHTFHCRRRTGGGQTRLYRRRLAASGFRMAALSPHEPPQPDREGLGDPSVEQADHGRRRRRLRVPHEDDEQRDEVRRRAHLGIRCCRDSRGKLGCLKSSLNLAFAQYWFCITFPIFPIGVRSFGQKKPLCVKRKFSLSISQLQIRQMK